MARYHASSDRSVYIPSSMLSATAGRLSSLGRGLLRPDRNGSGRAPRSRRGRSMAPNAAICLISALSYHEFTSLIPSSVHLAVPPRKLSQHQGHQLPSSSVASIRRPSRKRCGTIWRRFHVTSLVSTSCAAKDKPSCFFAPVLIESSPHSRL